MSEPVVPADDFEGRVRASFARQPFMATLGAVIERVEPGQVAIRIPYQEGLTQQHGYLHAGAIAAVLDSACGYAALSRMAPGTAVLTVEYKINLVAPAAGEEFIATGRVLRSGKTLTVCTGEVVARSGTSEAVVAVMQATVMSLSARTGRTD